MAFFFGAIQAQTSSVTFQVDGSQLGSIDPAGIHIAGTFNGFSPEPMVDEGGGIYSFTTDIDNNTTALYKYTNSPDFSAVESVPGDCGLDDGFGGNNRFVDVAEDDITLPVICFSSCTECQAPGESFELTLLVDASELASINPSGLHAAGTFNGFSPAQMTDLGGGSYSISVSVEEGSTVLWKYINGPTFDDEVESVPGACGADDGFGGFNRVLTMPSADTTAGPVCFSQCVACEVAPEDYLLTLSVDASDLDVINPDGGIHVAGTFNGFSPTAMNDEGDGTYTFSTMVAEGSQVLYKFLNSSDFSAAEEVPEACGEDDGFGGFNRALTMPSADLDVSLVCFSSCEACPEAPPCEDPYPQVDFSSLTTETLPNGALRFLWEPVEGSVACQVQIVVGNFLQSALKVVNAPNNFQFTVGPNSLVPFTTYNFRVRCACSINPVVVGPITAFSSTVYIPPSAITENGQAYANTPLNHSDSEMQWNNWSPEANLTGDIFEMKSKESWVRVAPNPAQDNVNLSYKSIEEGQGFVRVFDAQGKLAFERVITFNKGLNHVNLNMNELENGIYIVEVLQGESRESVRVLMQ